MPVVVVQPVQQMASPDLRLGEPEGLEIGDAALVVGDRLADGLLGLPAPEGRQEVPPGSSERVPGPSSIGLLGAPRPEDCRAVLQVPQGRRDNRQSARFTRSDRWSITEDGKLRLPKIGHVQAKWTRNLTLTLAQLGSVRGGLAAVARPVGDEAVQPV
jgi:hypothetical protein